MASEHVSQDTSTTPSTATPPAGPPTGTRQYLGRIASILLVISAAFQVVTLLLPWDHLAIPSEHEAFDDTVTSYITTVPFRELPSRDNAVPVRQ